jgi:hypothetical protein
VLTSGADKPKQHPDKVEPNPNLHPAAASIVAAVAVDVHLTEDAEQGSPEDAVGNTPISVPGSTLHCSSSTHKSIASQKKNLKD